MCPWTRTVGTAHLPRRPLRLRLKVYVNVNELYADVNELLAMPESDLDNSGD